MNLWLFSKLVLTFTGTGVFILNVIVMTKKHIKGLFAAPFTPLNPDGSVNLLMVPTLVENLIADGLSGAFICGSNGEGPNFTIEERMAVADAFVKAADKRIQIWVHVGHSSIAESRVLMQHAYDIGADAVSAVAAFYFKPSSVENLVDCMAQIAATCPEMPFYYYHIPVLTGVSMDMVRFLELAEIKIPNLQGIKYTANTIWEYQACLNHFGDRFNILYGFDEMLLPALSVGAEAAIGSTYNFAAPLYLSVMNDYRNGRHASTRQTMNLLIDMVRMLTKYPFIPGQKAVMKMLGNDVGGCRLPLVTLSEQQYEMLHNDLEKIGFWAALKASKSSVKIHAT
jgi:N-acetylneuraminate lyase